MRRSEKEPIAVNLRRQQRGQSGEELAARFLKQQGYRLVERNWRAGNAVRGEVDCIAWDGRTLCFVEVKTRSSNDYGAPQESVTRSKQSQISKLANAYVSLHRLSETPCRFDVVEVWLNDSEAPRLQLHRNAFDYIDQGVNRRRPGSRIF